MAEEITDRDPPAVGHEPRKPALDGVVEPESPLADELERDDRDEGLGDAARAEPIAGSQRHTGRERGEPARSRPVSCPVVDEHERTGARGGQDRLEPCVELGLRRQRGGCRGGGERRREREPEEDQPDSSEQGHRLRGHVSILCPVGRGGRQVAVPTAASETARLADAEVGERRCEEEAAGRDGEQAKAADGDRRSAGERADR